MKLTASDVTCSAAIIRSPSFSRSSSSTRITIFPARISSRASSIRPSQPRATKSKTNCVSPLWFDFYPLLQLRDHLRYRLEEVGHQPVVRHLEDRRLLVLVDRHDHPGVLHTRQVLDRTGYTQRNIKLRGHDLPRLPHLPAVRCPSSTDGCSGRPNRRLELVRKLLYQL